jgi:hypothetical protein
LINSYIRIARLHSKLNHYDSTLIFVDSAFNYVLHLNKYHEEYAHWNLYIAEIFYFYHNNIDVSIEILQNAYNFLCKYLNQSEIFQTCSDMLLRYQRAKTKQLLHKEQYYEAILDCLDFNSSFDTICDLNSKHFWFCIDIIGDCKNKLIQCDYNRRLEWIQGELSRMVNKQDLVNELHAFSDIYLWHYISKLQKDYSIIFTSNIELLKSQYYRVLALKMQKDYDINVINNKIIEIETLSVIDNYHFKNELTNAYDYVFNHLLEEINKDNFDIKTKRTFVSDIDNIVEHIIFSSFNSSTNNSMFYFKKVAEIIIPFYINYVKSNPYINPNDNMLLISEMLFFNSAIYKSLGNFRFALYTLIQSINLLNQLSHNYTGYSVNTYRAPFSSQMHLDIIEHRTKILKEISQLYYLNKDYYNSLIYCDLF